MYALGRGVKLSKISEEFEVLCAGAAPSPPTAVLSIASIDTSAMASEWLNISRFHPEARCPKA
jgi:hypothetical protein